MYFVQGAIFRVPSKCSSFLLASYQNKIVAIIKLRNENEQNVISYSQLRKWEISLLKIIQTNEIYTYFIHYTWKVSTYK